MLKETVNFVHFYSNKKSLMQKKVIYLPINRESTLYHDRNVTKLRTITVGLGSRICSMDAFVYDWRDTSNSGEGSLQAVI